ncbi:soluble IFN-g receptor [Deerpox virus W-1170-84]|uniref:Soluble IFN-g receptor n=1 Tax=Deerpox virus (strain W-1170-84) TaxID=305676 RepID=Q08FH0_DPV84|nr:soluble IFN-g receptor [Deerpox virus W-1170-84]AUI80572.1 soluble IFN-gamma receptor [White-tailed deer poxvirus]
MIKSMIVFLLFFVASALSKPSNVHFESYNFNTKIKWDDNKDEYNVSINNYETSWRTVCKNSIDVCDVSDKIKDNDMDTWVKLTNKDSEEFKQNLKSVCSIVIINPPNITLERKDSTGSILLTIKHPTALINGKKIPIYGNDKLCNTLLTYTANITFDDNEPVSYTINDYYCNKYQCKIIFESYQNVCVSVIGEDKDDYYPKITEPSETVCVGSINPLPVDMCVLKSRNDIPYLKERVKNIVDKKYKKKCGPKLKIYELILSLLDEMLLDIGEN